MSTGKRSRGSGEHRIVAETLPDPPRLAPKGETLPLLDPRVEQYLLALFPAADPTLTEMERLSRRGKKPEPVATAAVADAPVEEPVG